MAVPDFGPEVLVKIYLDNTLVTGANGSACNRNEGKYEYIGDRWNRENGSLSRRRPAVTARLYFSQIQ
jgi:hypothetical protein